jgi:hypothetical protein
MTFCLWGRGVELLIDSVTMALTGQVKIYANRRTMIEDLVKAIGEYRKSGGDHQAVHALKKALERAELLLQ